MRTRTKFVLLIMVACALSIFIYESIENVQPVKTSEDISEGEIPNIATVTLNNEDTPSNEVIVEIVEIKNPQTGNIIKYSFIIICMALISIIIIYTKKKGRIFKI